MSPLRSNYLRLFRFRGISSLFLLSFWSAGYITVQSDGLTPLKLQLLVDDYHTVKYVLRGHWNQDIPHSVYVYKVSDPNVH
jgi:hypothetical protein